jgi:ribose 5-phosphate isomerase A
MKEVSSNTELKKQAALAAAALVESGQRVGLGTGSTAAFVIEELGRRVRQENLLIECVATSFQAMNLAIVHGLRVFPIQALGGQLDISIDGADEIDPHLNLIKGGGAAHTMEKLVHVMSSRFIVVADDSKLVSKLGTRFPVPVEVIPFSYPLVEKKLKELGATEITMRMAVKKDGPVVTDNGNFVLDARFDIQEPEKLEIAINAIPGVLDNGIFSAASAVPERAFIAGNNGVEQRVR